MKGSKTNIQHNRVDSNKTKLCMKKESYESTSLQHTQRTFKKVNIFRKGSRIAACEPSSIAYENM